MVRPDLGQVFSYFGGMVQFWASTGRDMLLAETLFLFSLFFYVVHVQFTQ